MDFAVQSRANNPQLYINGELKDPSRTIADWLNMLLQDIRSGLTIDRYRIMSLLTSLSQSELDSIAGAIIRNFTIELDIPPGKVSLASYKDSLETILPHYSAKHILVLLYSISTGPRAEGINQQRNTSIIGALFSLRIEPVTPPTDANECVEPITIGSDSDQITFLVPRSVNYDAETHLLMQKLTNIHGIISRLNKLVPQNPVRTINIVDGQVGMYDETCYQITVGIDETEPVFTAAHEMGHHISYVRLGGEYLSPGNYFISCDNEWQNIFYMALKNGSYEPYDDSNYLKTGDETCHPFDDSWELFASALAAYSLRPEELIANLNDPDTDPYEKLIGRLVFCYLRDRIFNGQTFCANDPFKNIGYDSLRSQISEVSTDTFVDLLSDNDPHVRRAAMKAIVAHPIMDDRYIAPLISAVQDEDGEIRCAARNAIVVLNDRRFIPLLQEIKRAIKDNCIKFTAWETLTLLNVDEPRDFVCDPK